MFTDSHIHLFSPGFEHDHLAALADPQQGRAGSPDELTLYNAHRQHVNISQALVVGYEGLPLYEGNNTYLASLVGRHDWLNPVAFVTPEQLDVDHLALRDKQGFVGASMYLKNDDAAALADVASQAWQWLSDRHAIISLNAPAAASDLWQAWANVLAAHPSLTLLISHLGLPGQAADALAKDAIHTTLGHVLALARFPRVHVKFSAFYATSDPMHDYPHAQAGPAVEALVEAYGHDRLLWGSDFSPCLGFVSFPQTIAAAEHHLACLSQLQRAAIMGDNLARLLSQVAMGQAASRAGGSR